MPSTEELKDVVRCFNEEVRNQGNLDAVEKYFAEDYIDHGAPRARPGPEGVKPLVAQIHRLFREYRSEIEDLIAEGDKVVARLRVRGIHNGTMFDIPPTGKEAVWTETHIARFRDGKMVEHWFDYDGLGLKEQLSRAAAASAQPKQPS
jgi:predicted ester cyclase